MLRFALCWGLFAIAFAAGNLDAQAQAETRWVELSGDVDKDLEQLLSELLGRSGLSLTWGAPSSQGRVIARVHVQRSSNGARLDIVDPRGASPEQQLSVPLHGTEALFRETLAHVILGNIDPLATLDAENARATPATAAATAPPPPPIATAPVRQGTPAPIEKSRKKPEKHQADDGLHFTLGFGGGALLVARDRTAPIVEGSLGLAFAGALQPRASVSAGYMPPLGIDGEGLSANFRLLPLRARFAVEPWSSRWLAVYTGLGLGVDWLMFSPTKTSAELRAAPSSQRLAPVLGLLSGAQAHLSAELDVMLGLGLDLDATPRVWLVVAGERSTPVLETMRVRPSAALGLVWTFRSERATSPRNLGAR